MCLSAVYLQLCFAPVFLASFLGLSGALNGLTVEQNLAKQRRVRTSSPPGNIISMSDVAETHCCHIRKQQGSVSQMIQYSCRRRQNLIYQAFTFSMIMIMFLCDNNTICYYHIVGSERCHVFDTFSTTCDINRFLQKSFYVTV